MRAAEIHDASVVAVRAEGGSVVVVLRSFVHENIDDGSMNGAFRTVEVALHDAHVDGHAPGNAWAYDGDLTIDGRSERGCLPIGLRADGQVTLEISGNSFALIIRARAVEVRQDTPTSPE